MSKLGKAIKALWWILRRPVLLNRVLTDEDTWRNYVAKKYQMKEGLPVVSLDHLIAAGSIEIGPMTFLDGGSLPTDLMLLAALAEQIKDCRYFEIGTWRGESVATISPRALSCHTLCLTDQEMQQRGMQADTIASHMQFSAKLKNVTQLRGDSRVFDFEQLDQKFDLIFIDGDHHYDYVLSDTIEVFKHLVHHRSVVVWHDYGFHPDQVRYEVMAAILDGSGADRAGRIYQVAHTKSAIFTGQELSAAPAGNNRMPVEFFKARISRHTLKNTIS